MTQQSRRRTSSNTTRRQRRATGARTYTTPAPRATGGARMYTTPAAQAPSTLRRSYMAEPAPVDYATEYRYIRKDLLRIVLWATILIGVMIALRLLNIF